MRKNCAIVADADVLEHSDRDDAIERSGDLAIVPEEKADALAEALLGGATVGHGKLLVR